MQIFTVFFCGVVPTFAGAVDDKVNPYKGRSLFLHENGRSSNFYYDETFRPVFDVRPLLPLN